MRKAGGYATICDPDAPLVERDTLSCGHCNRIVFVRPGSGVTIYLIQHRDGRWTEEAGAFCRVCMRPVCLTCHADGRCLPFEARLAQAEAAVRHPLARPTRARGE